MQHKKQVQVGPSGVFYSSFSRSSQNMFGGMRRAICESDLVRPRPLWGLQPSSLRQPAACCAAEWSQWRLGKPARRQAQQTCAGWCGAPCLRW